MLLLPNSIRTSPLFGCPQYLLLSHFHPFFWIPMNQFCCKLSKNCPRDVFRLLLLSNRQSKLPKFFFYWHKWRRKAHIDCQNSLWQLTHWQLIEWLVAYCSYNTDIVNKRPHPVLYVCSVVMRCLYCCPGVQAHTDIIKSCITESH